MPRIARNFYGAELISILIEVFNKDYPEDTFYDYFFLEEYHVEAITNIHKVKKDLTVSSKFIETSPRIFVGQIPFYINLETFFSKLIYIFGRTLNLPPELFVYSDVNENSRIAWLYLQNNEFAEFIINQSKRIFICDSGFIFIKNPEALNILYKAINIFKCKFRIPFPNHPLTFESSAPITINSKLLINNSKDVLLVQNEEHFHAIDGMNNVLNLLSLSKYHGFFDNHYYVYPKMNLEVLKEIKTSFTRFQNLIETYNTELKNYSYIVLRCCPIAFKKLQMLAYLKITLESCLSSPDIIKYVGFLMNSTHDIYIVVNKKDEDYLSKLDTSLLLFDSFGFYLLQTNIEQDVWYKIIFKKLKFNQEANKIYKEHLFSSTFSSTSNTTLFDLLKLMPKLKPKITVPHPTFTLSEPEYKKLSPPSFVKTMLTNVFDNYKKERDQNGVREGEFRNVNFRR